MKSLSRVGLGLSVVFGCLLLALIAEIYYLLWWKKKITESGNDEEDSCDNGTGRRELLCCKKASSSSTTNAQQLCTSNTLVHEPQPHHHLHVYSNLKPFGEDLSGVEAEIRMLQQNFSGPPRFLFTITEETREEMESEDDRKSAKKSRSRSLSDLVETPFLTPLANSPPYFTPPLTPTHNQKLGFNPFCELASDAEFNSCLRSSSPPPKFQFLKDAEYKLQRRQLDMDEKSVQLEVPSTSMFIKDEENGSFITLIVPQNKQEEETNRINNSSTSSQFPSSPTQTLS